MSTGHQREDDMRKQADWMVPADNRILELIREYGNLTPSAIDDKGGPVRQYTSERCSKLAEYGLLVQVHRGLYGISEEGHAYLNEELDASTLEPDADSDE